jgi:hypothetical protein
MTVIFKELLADSRLPAVTENTGRNLESCHIDKDLAGALSVQYY